MNLDKAKIADIEADGLLDELTKIHVLSLAYPDKKGKYKIKSTSSLDDIVSLLENPDNIIVGHNFIKFDIEAVKKVKPDIEIKAFIIDTLYLSFYLYSERDDHKLESWGEFFGVEKPKIEPGEWKGPLEGETQEQFQAKMTHRCEEDVKINTNLWVKCLRYLRKIYDNDDALIINVIKNLNNKGYCLLSQEQNPILLDIPQVKKNLEILEDIIEEKKQALQSIMPKVAKTAKKTKPTTLYKAPKSKPKTMYKANGELSKAGKSYIEYLEGLGYPEDYDGEIKELSVAGEKWFDLLREKGLPKDYDGEVEYVVRYEEPNGSSDPQIKDFLFSKGWKPRIFKDGANGKVPQLRDDNKNLCESVQVLIEKYPELEALDGLSVAKHRAGYLKAFLDSADEKGYAVAWASGFTRTLRLKHSRPFVNLPKPDAKYGEYIRSCMVAPKGYVCIGADLSSIEDKCKQISIYPLDPKYVKSMNIKGWDAHLALGLKAGMFTEDEVQFYKWFDSDQDPEKRQGECPESFKGLTPEEQKTAFSKLKKVRAKAKTTNYSATYGAGAPKIAIAGDMSVKQAKKLHKTYWDMNWSVKRFAEDRIVKTVKDHNWFRRNKKAGGLTEVKELNWIWNEHTKLWLFLKNDKDRFSACNQNFGVKIFDVWVYLLMEKGVKPIYQSHDEVLWYAKKSDVPHYTAILDESVIRLNKIFKPPVPIEIDYKIGKNYSLVH